MARDQTTKQRLLDEVREILEMAESLKAAGKPIEAMTFALAAAERMRAIRALQEMRHAGR